MRRRFSSLSNSTAWPATSNAVVAGRCRRNASLVSSRAGPRPRRDSGGERHGGVEQLAGRVQALDEAGRERRSLPVEGRARVEHPPGEAEADDLRPDASSHRRRP